LSGQLTSSDHIENIEQDETFSSCFFYALADNILESPIEPALSDARRPGAIPVLIFC
jgi:hypothetical protein